MWCCTLCRDRKQDTEIPKHAGTKKFYTECSLWEKGDLKHVCLARPESTGLPELGLEVYGPRP